MAGACVTLVACAASTPARRTSPVVERSAPASVSAKKETDEARARARRRAAVRAYITGISEAARERNVDVIWVNPPMGYQMP